MNPSKSYGNPYQKRHNNFKYYEEVQYIDRMFHSDIHSSMLQVYLCSWVHTFPNPKKKNYFLPKDAPRAFYWIVSYLISGNGTLEVDGERTSVKAGDVIIRKPNTISAVHQDKGEAVSLFAFYLVDSPSAICLCGKENPFACSICHPEDQEKLHQLMEEMKNTVESGKLQVCKKLSILAYSFLMEADDVMNMDGTPGNFEKILFAIRRAPQHYKGITSLMKEFGLSKRKLYEMFAKNTQTTPTQFLISEKLDKSRWFLIHSSYSLQYIARICGYNSLAFYSREFKRKYHLSPDAYRKQNQELSR